MYDLGYDCVMGDAFSVIQIHFDVVVVLKVLPIVPCEHWTLRQVKACQREVVVVVTVV